MLRALEEFGAPIDNLSTEDLATPGLLYVFGIAPLRVDILNRIKGNRVYFFGGRSLLISWSYLHRC